MVKITIDLDDKLYNDVVKESIVKYGNTKNVLKIINQRLRNKNPVKGKIEKGIAFNLKILMLTL